MPKVGDSVRFRDNGPSVEEARRKMLEAGEAPKQIAKETKKNEAVGVTRPTRSAPPSVQQAPVQQAPAPVATASPAPAAPAPTAREDKSDRYENNSFIAEIRQEGGKWIADITYKNGAGPERFVEDTKSDLMRALLIGKANATIRVREVTREQKTGGPAIDKEYNLPDGFSRETFATLPQEAKDALVSELAHKNALIFCEQHHEFYANEENSETVEKFLFNKSLPFTVRNFEYALRELGPQGDDILVPRPSPTTAFVSAPTTPVATVAVDSAPVAAPAPVASATSAPAAPATRVRTRGTTGIQPGFSSSTELEDITEETGTSREPSEAELRKSSPSGQPVSAELKAAYQATIAARRKARGF